MDITAALIAVLAVLALLACAGLAYIAGRSSGTAASRAMGDAPLDLAPLEGALERLGRRLEEVETVRRSDQVGLRTELHEHLRHVEATAEVLRRETGQLAAALGRADVRGRWGEAHLRRLVEAAGMIDRVHFIEQDVRSGDDSAQRPDLVIDLGGGRQLVVDAKVPLAALLLAEAADDPALRQAHYAQHARDVAQHVDKLGSKSYWRAYDDSIEAVVMFLPAESLLGVALRDDPALLERAFAKDVLIATPTTLLALLRTVSHVWRREALADSAREIHLLGRELHERLGVALDHVGRVGSSLDATVNHYNRLVGSLEGRVLVSARRLTDYGVGAGALPDLPPVTQRPRDLSAGDDDRARPAAGLGEAIPVP